MRMAHCRWLLMAVLAFVCNVWAQAPYREGLHYTNLPADVTENYVVQEFIKADPHPIQIIQFFNYGCHGCYQFEPLLQNWLDQQDMSKISFRRVPVVFHPAWRPLAKAYYTAFSLGLNQVIDSVFFRAIHVEQKKLFETGDIEAVFTQNGVTSEMFDKTFSSFSVNRQLKEANQLAVAFRVPVIPMLIVHTSTGTYMTSPSMAGNLENTVAALDWLVKNR